MLNNYSFQENGFAVIRNLFSESEINYYKIQLDLLSRGRGQKWTLPNGVCRNRAFWDVIFNPKILIAARSILGENIRFLQHNDLHVGFSSFHWHRDSVCRTYGKGPDWDEFSVPYQLLRVGIYLQESSGGFKLGLIPGSHRPDLNFTTEQAAQIERNSSTLTKALTMLGGKDPLKEHASWIATEPGDGVLFDPRVIHTGSEFSGTKYSFFVAYGTENEHFKNHYRYYRHLRDDLGYQALHPELAERLEAAGLYAGEPFDETPVPGAWMPSKAFSAVARHFK